MRCKEKRLELSLSYHEYARYKIQAMLYPENCVQIHASIGARAFGHVNRLLKDVIRLLHVIKQGEEVSERFRGKVSKGDRTLR